MAGRKPKPTPLLEAVRFASAACNETGDTFETHLAINAHRVTGSNRIFHASAPVAEEITAYPRADLLVKALERAGSDLAITQAEGRLGLASGKVRFSVPCVAAFPTIDPDAAVAPCDDSFRDCLAALYPLSTETIPYVFLNGPSALATNRMVVIEYWHGLSVPTVALPSAFVERLVKTTAKIVGLGASDRSLTIHFEGDYWIKTQLGEMNCPNFDPLWIRPHEPKPLHEAFWKALTTILPFSDDGLIRFKDGALQTHDSPEQGALYRLPVLPGPSFNGKWLRLTEGLGKTYGFTESSVYFYGDKVRGIVMGDVRN